MIYITISILSQSLALLFIKIAALQIENFEIIKLLNNPYIYFAIICFGLQSIFWQLALKKYNLSFAYYFMSLKYFLYLGIGYFIFSENVNFVHILGLIVIVFGIIIFVRKEEKIA